MTSYGPVEPVIFVLYLMAFLVPASVTDLRNSAENEKTQSRARWWHGFVLSLICIALLYPLNLITYTGGPIDYIRSKQVFNALLLFALVTATWLQATSSLRSRYIPPLEVLFLPLTVILFGAYALQGNASYPGFPTPWDLGAFGVYVAIGLTTLVLGVLLGLHGRLQSISPHKKHASWTQTEERS
jgi:hypothetical protein